MEGKGGNYLGKKSSWRATRGSVAIQKLSLTDLIRLVFMAIIKKGLDGHVVLQTPRHDKVLPDERMVTILHKYNEFIKNYVFSQ